MEFEKDFNELNGEKRAALALMINRELVTPLFEREEYVESKLVEIPIELCLDFLSEKMLAFNKIYGFVTALMWFLQEKPTSEGASKIIEAVIDSTLYCSKIIYDYHITTEGKAPPADCYIGEVNEEDPLNSVRKSIEAIVIVQPNLSADLVKTLTAYIQELSQTDVSQWASNRRKLEIYYPFN